MPQMYFYVSTQQIGDGRVAETSTMELEEIETGHTTCDRDYNSKLESKRRGAKTPST